MVILRMRTSMVTLDFEASSLDETSYPIEVAFVLGNSAGVSGQFSTLIKPRTNWKGPNSWSEKSQAIHKINRDELQSGMDADAVCDLLNAALAGAKVYVDGGSFDAFWLDRLYNGQPCHFQLDFLTDIDPLKFNSLKRNAVPKHRALADAHWLFDTICHLKGVKAPAG